MTNNFKTELYNSFVMDFFEEGTTEEILFSGLASEVGEVMQERTKEIRRGENKTKEIIDELSDVLWYVTVIARMRGFSLKDLMTHNYNKLELRSLGNKV